MENSRELGLCPICGFGHIIEKEFGWTCSNSAKLSDGSWRNCPFVVYKNMHGADITEDIVKELIDSRETGVLDMRNKEGKPFQAKLAVRDGKIQLDFVDRYLDGVCPVCGGRVKVTSKGYACENFFKHGPGHCNFFIGASIGHRVITEEEAENFLQGKQQILDGFTSKQGKNYSSLLTLTPEGKAWLNSEVATCPKCGGTIRVGSKAFNCSNYNTPDISCKFSIWRRICGHDVTPEEVRQLCDNGETDEVLHFYKENGSQFDKKLKLIDGEVRLA